MAAYTRHSQVGLIDGPDRLLSGSESRPQHEGGGKIRSHHNWRPRISSL